MRKRRALAIAIATALGALTAAAATHPVSLHNTFARARSAALRSERELAVAVRGERVETLSGHAANDVDRLVKTVRSRSVMAAENVIALPVVTIRALDDDATTFRAKSAPKAAAPCRPSWRSLDTGPSARRVRALCPAELADHARPEASAVEVPTKHESAVEQRLEVPHAFLGDHLVDPTQPLAAP